MPTFTIGDLTLKDEDFTETVSLTMPRALGLLIMRLGATCLVFDDTQDEFLPTSEALEICRVIESRPGISESEIEARAIDLRKAIKAAYDAYSQLPTAAEDAVFRPAP